MGFGGRLTQSDGVVGGHKLTIRVVRLGELTIRMVDVGELTIKMVGLWDLLTSGGVGGIYYQSGAVGRGTYYQCGGVGAEL